MKQEACYFFNRENLIHWECSLNGERRKEPFKVESIKVCMNIINTSDACSKVQYYDNSANIPNSYPQIIISFAVNHS